MAVPNLSWQFRWDSTEGRTHKVELAHVDVGSSSMWLLVTTAFHEDNLLAQEVESFMESEFDEAFERFKDVTEVYAR